ncbi:hypothetical protein Bca52824_051524 [Brassica carinata]|uniref:DUF223 domain-containing protein n=1 Tax=Brassica carinata TaxID=52824 RepID=A0A8X7UIZ9_BRACI|nr:hypothetical protein Bca52824_051524 [Brassica carinata]
MSNERKMCLIKDLKPFRDEWRLTLKLLHSWKQTTSYGGDTLECVLVDQTGAKIQASCKRSQITRVQRYLRVGEWKVIDTVKITGVGVGQYRPTTQQYKMTIIGDTSITPSDYRNDNHFLNLANYEEIGNGKLKPHFLIDIMGQVTDLGPVAMVQAKGNDMKRVHFRLRDTSGHEVACCLWGKYAEQFESVEEANDESIICLIRFAKISEYRGEKQITNAFDASLVFLNPTMEEAIDFKQKLTVARSFVQLKPLTQTGVGSILGVRDTIYVLLGLVGNLLIEDPEILPQPIRDLVGKSFCFGLAISLVQSILRIESVSEPVSLIETNSSTLSGGELLAIDHINENSSEDVSTPSNKRKEDECDQMDMTSTSKKLCTNIIKVEKTKTD